MKELSIEEKAKAYDGLIERLKDLKFAYRFSPLSDTIEEMFPELRESKDERIRKEIIAFITYYHTGQGNSVKYNEDWIAWLEKQGEPLDKIAERARTEKQRVLLTETNGAANIDWDTRSLRDVKLLLEYGLDYIKKLEKQGEQKPNPCDGCVNRKGCINCENGELKETEQKPAWSEEDEKMIRGLIVICDEWTTRHSFYPIENCEIEKLKNWLYSLKERYTWKPNDEQMKALEYQVHSTFEGSWQYKASKELLEQLKKL